MVRRSLESQAQPRTLYGAQYIRKIIIDQQGFYYQFASISLQRSAAQEKALAGMFDTTVPCCKGHLGLGTLVTLITS
jgi:hypothetical protein